MLFGWGERKVIKTKNLTPQTNPLGTRRCFVHPWRLGGSTVWGDDFPPLVVTCPPAGRTIPHPWSSTTPPLGAWLCLPPPHACLVSPFFWRTRVPPLACVMAGTCALGGEPGKATQPREVGGYCGFLGFAAAADGELRSGHTSICLIYQAGASLDDFCCGSWCQKQGG